MFFFDLDKGIVYSISGFRKTGGLKTDLSLVMKNVRNKEGFALLFFFLTFGYVVPLNEHF